MKYHILAFVTGFILDFIIGDPHWLPHPIRLIGSFIANLEHRLNNKNYDNNIKLKNGKTLVFSVASATLIVSSFLIIASYLISPYLGMIIESIMTYQILAAKCLKVESMKVYTSITTDGLEAGRKAVSMIVGRDTKVLDEKGVIKAAVETVAENTSDGVIAPMIYTVLGGPILGFAYKAVNTMDSMVGYKNDKFLYFGRTAAKLDDIVNFIPSRISAYLMILAAYLGGKQFDGHNAYRIFKRDRFNHASPNSAQTESVCAGALCIRLAGDAVYFGKLVKKPFIGDAIREVEPEDIKRANQLMYTSAVLCELICLVILSIIYFAIHYV